MLPDASWFEAGTTRGCELQSACILTIYVHDRRFQMEPNFLSIDFNGNTWPW